MVIKKLLKKIRENDIDISVNGNNLQLRSDKSDLPQTLYEEIKRYKEEIILYLKDNISDEVNYNPIPKVPVQSNYSLSSHQRRLWISCQFEEANMAYNMPGDFFIEGPLNKKALDATFAELLRRHESLRTTFTLVEGIPVQKINDPDVFNFAISHIDIRNKADKEILCEQLLSENILYSFDLENGPLIKVKLIQLAEESYRFLLSIHHLIFDGRSLDILIKEMLICYNAFRKNETPALLPLKIQYKDYAAWHNSILSSGRWNVVLQYWKNRLGNPIPELKLPINFPRPPEQCFEGDDICFAFPDDLTNELIAMSAEFQTTLFSFLFTAYNVLISKITGQDSIVLGTPVAGRNHSDLEGLIGFFVNTIAVRTDIHIEQPFALLLKETHEHLLRDYEYQDMPFDLLIQHLNVKRDSSITPVFQSQFVFDDYSSAPFLPEENNTREIRIINTTSQFKKTKFELSTNIYRNGNTLECRIQFRTDLFKLETIQDMSRQFITLLKNIVRSPDTKIDSLEILSEHEKQEIVNKRKEKLNSKYSLLKK